MEKLNDLKKPKHEHKGTDILKVLIFSLVMLAPFFAILSKCLYTLNQNAKDSYYGETINETSFRNIDYDKLEINKTYYFIKQELGNLQSTTSLFYNVSNVTNNYNQLTNCNRIRFTADYLTFYNYDTYISAIQFSNSASNVSFNFQGIYSTQTNASNINDYLFIKEYNNYSYIDNVFYYATDQLGNEQLFSWTKSTAIYGAVNGLTSGMGIDPTNNVLAILITYWSLTTAVYVVMDIVIELFKKLTHLIN